MDLNNMINLFDGMTVSLNAPSKVPVININKLIQQSGGMAATIDIPAAMVESKLKEMRELAEQVKNDSIGGGIFIPAINDSVLSWSNNKGLPNPEPIVMKGEKGDKGERGEQGERGLQGEQGIQGERGEKGEQGIQGERGEKGDKGEDGIGGVKSVNGIEPDANGNVQIEVGEAETDPVYTADKPNIAFKNDIPVNLSDLENDVDYIKATDIPTTQRAAGVKAGNWLSIDDGSTNPANKGKMKCGELTKAQYDGATGYTFISKTTLENVLAAKVYTKAEVDALLAGIKKMINGG